MNQLSSINHQDDMTQASRDHLSDSDDEREGGVSFARMTMNSMITAQRWPWTQMVELTTDRKFYRNEVENTYQFNPPKEFQDEDHSGQGHSNHHDSNGPQKPQRRRLGVVNSQGKEKSSNRNVENYLNTISLENSNMYLREKYNSELIHRRQHLKSQIKRSKTDEWKSRGDDDLDDDDDNLDSFEQQLRRYDPPENAPIDAITNYSTYWKELYEIQLKVEQDIFSPWHDAHILLQRLRRLDDMKQFVENFKETQLKYQAQKGQHSFRTHSG